MYETVLPLLRDADLDVALINFTPRQIQEKLQQGIPLLIDVDLDIDVASARELMLKLANAGVEKKSSTFQFQLPWTKPAAEDHAAALKIMTAVEENTLDAGHLLSLIAAGEHDAVSAAAAELCLDAGLVLALARNTLKPALRTWCRQLVPLVKEIVWQSAVCFLRRSGRAGRAAGQWPGQASAVRDVWFGLAGQKAPVRAVRK
jgi:hypothetical protein